jgi:SOS response regulatory protein OraA/RecX
VDPEKLALEAAQKKLISYQKLAPKEFKIKMGQYLVRKGFNWDVIAAVVDTLAKKD